MSGREWKPGDVAMVESKASTDGACLAIRTTRATWRCEHGQTVDEKVDSLRPLVVIDPEDQEHRARFRQMAINYIHGDWTAEEAVRGLSTPPKPDEPTGLGAVVEDAKGDRWTRTGDDESVDRWHSQIGRVFTSRDYDRIDVVRVLSEGVTQ